MLPIFTQHHLRYLRQWWCSFWLRPVTRTTLPTRPFCPLSRPIGVLLAPKWKARNTPGIGHTKRQLLAMARSWHQACFQELVQRLKHVGIHVPRKDMKWLGGRLFLPIVCSIIHRIAGKLCLTQLDPVDWKSLQPYSNISPSTNRVPKTLRNSTRRRRGWPAVMKLGFVTLADTCCQHDSMHHSSFHAFPRH